MREHTTSSVGPAGPPSRCSSSTMNSGVAATALRCRQRRDSMSQRSGVVTTMLARSSALRSAAVSPLSSTTVRPSPSPNFLPQSAARSLASASSGAQYTARGAHLPSAARASMRSSANSAQMVLPLPVGAATSVLSSLLYSEEKACVCNALNAPSPRYSASNAGLRSAVGGSGCRSSSSVGGGNLSGRMRWRNDTGSTASACSHRSLTTRTKYCGGSGSDTGTVNDSTCSSSA
mmetsp:Transcript_30308/g.77308  ORF Transcript_30308/g.77308 Transcript_30308/m.77308 type:complete len:233 (-) Transcript_30308:3948-4646(-)